MNCHCNWLLGLVWFALVATSLGIVVAQEAGFRIGIGGQQLGGQGYRIHDLLDGSSLLAPRSETGAIETVKPGELVVELNGKPFSPILLDQIRDDLIKTNGLAKLQLWDPRTRQKHRYSVVLNRTDVSKQMFDDFRKTVREEYADNQSPGELRLLESAESISLRNFSTAFFPPPGTSLVGEQSPSALSILAGCQLGIDRLMTSAREREFEHIIPKQTFARAEAILKNAYGEVGLRPDSEQSKNISLSAQQAIIDEFMTAINVYAKQQGLEVLMLTSRPMLDIRFRVVTRPDGMIVEVIPRADVRLYQKRKPKTTEQEIDRLSAWTPLPDIDAFLYGRYYYRLRKPTRELLFGYHPDKYVVVLRPPPENKLLFQ